MSSDYVARLAEYVGHLEETVAKYGAGADEYVVTLNLNHDEGGVRDALYLADLRAILDELERLRAERSRTAPGFEAGERYAKLLTSMRLEGGEWSPGRARDELVRLGYAVTLQRAHQIMKTLAWRGYLEQVRPRAYTYRLKAEAPQQPENGGEA